MACRCGGSDIFDRYRTRFLKTAAILTDLACSLGSLLESFHHSQAICALVVLEMTCPNCLDERAVTVPLKPS